MVFSELDVFKKCASSKTSSHKLSKALGLDSGKGKESSKVILKLYYKAWSGLTKFIRSQVKQNRLVYFPIVGSFAKICILDANSQSEEIVFIPDLKFLDKEKLSFSDNKTNKNPYAENKASKIKVSPSSIAQV